MGYRFIWSRTGRCFFSIVPSIGHRSRLHLPRSTLFACSNVMHVPIPYEYASLHIRDTALQVENAFCRDRVLLLLTSSVTDDRTLFLSLQCCFHTLKRVKHKLVDACLLRDLTSRTFCNLFIFASSVAYLWKLRILSFARSTLANSFEMHAPASFKTCLSSGERVSFFSSRSASNRDSLAGDMSLSSDDSIEDNWEPRRQFFNDYSAVILESHQFLRLISRRDKPTLWNYHFNLSIFLRRKSASCRISQAVQLFIEKNQNFYLLQDYKSPKKNGELLFERLKLRLSGLVLVALLLRSRDAVEHRGDRTSTIIS